MLVSLFRKSSKNIFAQSAFRLFGQPSLTITRKTSIMQKTENEKKITKSWKDLNFWTSKTWIDIQKYLREHPNFYPPRRRVFRALNLTPLSRTKVVILGQDPYTGINQANGLAFSVDHALFPPSLDNIFKELCKDTGAKRPRTGDLSIWAKQGVLLLNTILTVEHKNSMSHAGIGWEELTREIIKQCYSTNLNTVFLLFGREAQSFADCLPDEAYRIMTAHPSPRSANVGGFFGTRPFTRTNDFLSEIGQRQINWGALPSNA